MSIISLFPQMYLSYRNVRMFYSFVKKLNKFTKLFHFNSVYRSELEQKIISVTLIELSKLILEF